MSIKTKEHTELVQLRTPSSNLLRLLIFLVCSLLLTGCATLFGISQPDFQPLPPSTIKEPATLLLKLEKHLDDESHHLEAVLTVNSERIYLIILGPLGQRLATLSFEDQKLTVKRDSPIPLNISLKDLFRELQMTFWPLTELNSKKRDQAWFFQDKKNIRLVYHKQKLIAEIDRHPISTWSGEFTYKSKTADHSLSIRSSLLD